jgi:hypothetical protein
VLPPNDNIFRGAHHPYAFQNRAFRHSKLIKLYTDPQAPRNIEASVVWERYAPTLSLVHAYGCRTSRQRNARGGSRDVYCGAYQLKVRHIRNLAATPNLPEVATADIVHKVENNELAHASCFITLHENVDEETIEAVKTAIAACLWNDSRGPLSHICIADLNLNPHPNERLERTPQGLYFDDRSRLQRMWAWVRYWFLFWLGRHFTDCRIGTRRSTMFP